MQNDRLSAETAGKYPLQTKGVCPIHLLSFSFAFRSFTYISFLSGPYLLLNNFSFLVACTRLQPALSVGRSVSHYFMISFLDPTAPALMV